MTIKSIDNVKKIKQFIIISSILSFFVQAIFFSNAENNILCSLLSLIFIIIGSLYIFRYHIFNFPVTSSMLVGYLLYFFFFPLLITTIEGKMLVYNLKEPILVATHSGLLFIILLFFHFLHREINQRHFLVSFYKSIYSYLGIFRPLSVSQIFAIGIISSSFLIITTPFRHTGTDEILIKFLEGFFTISYLPYVLFFPELFPVTGKISTLQKKFLYIYPLISIITGLSQNHRTDIVYGFANVLILYLFVFMASLPRKTSPIKTIAYSITFMITTFIIFPNIAFSLIAVRDIRTDVSTEDLFYRTIDAAFDNERLNKVKLLLQPDLFWDESYIDNPLFNRLSNLKYIDNTIHIAEQISEFKKNDLFRIETDRVISAFPSPVIKFLGIKIDKKSANAGSGGDFLASLFYNDESMLGGFREGSLIGSAYALFGWSYLIILGIISFITFLIVDQFSIIHIHTNGASIYTNGASNKSKYLDLRFSYVFGIKAFSFCFYFTSAATGIESFSGCFSFLLRGWVEIPLLLFIFFLFLKKPKHYYQ